jgi:uncharacterized protein (DUF302 family)
MATWHAPAARATLRRSPVDPCGDFRRRPHRTLHHQGENIMKIQSVVRPAFTGTLALMTGLMLAVAPGRALAQDGAVPVVQVRAKGSVPQVLDQLKKMIASNGMMVMGELHQGKVIGMTGLKLESESIFVGNPQVGKQMFSADPGVGIAVPIRINVYQDARGNTVVSYVPPSELLRSFHNAKVDQVAQRLDGKLRNLTGMLGGM